MYGVYGKISKDEKPREEITTSSSSVHRGQKERRKYVAKVADDVEAQRCKQQMAKKGLQQETRTFPKKN